MKEKKHKETKSDRDRRLPYVKTTREQVMPDKKTSYTRKKKHKGKEFD